MGNLISSLGLSLGEEMSVNYFNKHEIYMNGLIFTSGSGACCRGNLLLYT